ncbi:MAG TPA: DUF4097 family beta strand repeat-containing protein [Candidatus Eisenbacteria bacterium]|jgi:DUF4097 and DUF4098 domain-containing protein YvlB
MNRTLVALLLSTTILGRPARAGERLVEQSDRDLDARGIAALSVENPRGAVRVSPDSGGRIHVKAVKIVRANDREAAQEFARETQVSLSTEGGRCRITVRYPQRRQLHVGLWQMLRGDFDFPAVEIRLAISAPPGLPLELHSTSGDLATERMAGRQELSTTSGEIDVFQAGDAVKASGTSGSVRVSGAGSAWLRSVSGDVTAESVGGPLDAHTTSGELVVRGARDSLALGTVSGNIRVEGAPRGIVATSTSGDIEARGAAGGVRLGTASGRVDVGLVPPLREVDISSSSGDIEARLADGVGCEVELRTSNGSIDTSLPIELSSVTRHRVSGRVRGGTTPVVLRTSSGDIRFGGGGS